MEESERDIEQGKYRSPTRPRKLYFADDAATKQIPQTHMLQEKCLAHTIKQRIIKMEGGNA